MGSQSNIRTIGVFTSGGDAPGMNACVRAVVRASLYYGCKVVGIRNGFQGMIDNKIFSFKYEDVSNIIQRGGTVLGTARSKEFMTQEGRKKAFENLKQHEVDALVVIGGDGSFAGALALQNEFGVKCIGIPGTIDNDLFGTDYTLGFDTALNTVVEVVDKIRDTASSHNRLFIVEVMGRDAGFIALNSGIGVGAEDILIPETDSDMDFLIEKLRYSKIKRKSSIVIVAEGDEVGGGMKVAEVLKKALPDYDMRVSILGHFQRGGSPSAFDRLLASLSGVEAVKSLLNGKSGFMVGYKNNTTTLVPLAKSIKEHAHPDIKKLELIKILSAE